MKGGNVDDTSFVYGTPVSRLGRHSERRDPERQKIRPYRIGSTTNLYREMARIEVILHVNHCS